MDLVEAMAVARWRLRRIWAIEASLLANELTRRAEDIDDEFTEMTGEDRLAWVFERLAMVGPASRPDSPPTNDLHWPEQQVKGVRSCETLSVTPASSQQESLSEHSLCSQRQPNRNSPLACV
jgi:hypothetical protein